MTVIMVKIMVMIIIMKVFMLMMLVMIMKRAIIAMVMVVMVEINKQLLLCGSMQEIGIWQLSQVMRGVMMAVTTMVVIMKKMVMIKMLI